MSMKRYLKLDSNGNVLKDIFTSIIYDSPEYVEIPRNSSDLLARGLEKVRWNGTELVEKDEIRLVVGTTQMPADGVTTCAICVRGDNLEDTDEVTISVNGQLETITKINHLELYTDEPGQFFIKLEDPNYTARPSSHTIIAYLPEPEETEEDDTEEQEEV